MKTQRLVDMVSELDSHLYEIEGTDYEGPVFSLEIINQMHTIKFGNEYLWSDEDDEREYHDNGVGGAEYEPLFPYIKKQFNKLVGKMSGLRFDYLGDDDAFEGKITYSKVSIWEFDDLWEEGYRFYDAISNCHCYVPRDKAKNPEEAKNYLVLHRDKLEKHKGTSKLLTVADRIKDAIVIIERPSSASEKVKNYLSFETALDLMKTEKATLIEESELYQEYSYNGSDIILREVGKEIVGPSFSYKQIMSNKWFIA